MLKNFCYIATEDPGRHSKKSRNLNRTIITIFVLIFTILFINCSDPDNNESSSDIEGFDDIQSYILDEMKWSRTPSISIAVAKDGKIIWEESFGWANREKKIKATPHTIYSLASISKPMTATAIMVLVERGLIDLNEPINFYLRESNVTIYEGSSTDATVSRLLHHTAGLPTIWNFYFDEGQLNRPPISESIKNYGILTSPPGTVYEYSNLGYGIAEHIIERVSDKSFTKFMKTEVFEPLGLSRTFVASDKSQYDSIAVRYLENKNGSPFYETMSRGGGGICASVHDLVRFGMFHLKDHLSDQEVIISDSTIEYMQTCVDPMVPDSPYKLGWDVKEMENYRVVSHGGGMPGVSSVLILVPSVNMAIAVLSNGTYIDLYKIGSRIMRQILPGKKPEDMSVNQNENQSDTYDQFPSEKFTGSWHGYIRAGDDSIPINLYIDDSGDVKLDLVEEGRECIPVEPFQYKYGRLNGSFDFNIPTIDASVARHKVYMSLNLNNNRLSGYVAAISYRVEVFFLPYYINLRKDMDIN